MKNIQADTAMRDSISRPPRTGGSGKGQSGEGK